MFSFVLSQDTQDHGNTSHFKQALGIAYNLMEPILELTTRVSVGGPEFNKPKNKGYFQHVPCILHMPLYNFKSPELLICSGLNRNYTANLELCIHFHTFINNADLKLSQL